MKLSFIIFSLMLAISCFANLVPGSIYVSSTGSGANIQVIPASSGVNVTSFRVHSPSGNSSNICLGDSTVNSTGWSCLSAGEDWDIPVHPKGKLYKLSDAYIHFVGASDNAVIQYWTE